MANTVRLAWDANTESNLAGYQVYRSEESGIYGSPIAQTAQILFTDSTVQRGKTYFYTVTALDTDGNESLKSSEVTATVPVIDALPPSLP